jgi:HKD family nuclease
MKFLASPNEIASTITSLICKCERIRWAVAWGSIGFAAFDALTKHTHKIEQLTVGLHFWQTHPAFIKAFLNHPKVRFVREGNGAVFHPKLYLFEHRGQEWDCVVGSSNFTLQGFSTNNEAGVLIGSDDSEAATTKNDINVALDSFYLLGEPFDISDLPKYCEGWKKRRQRVRPLRADYRTFAQKPRPIWSADHSSHKSPNYFVGARGRDANGMTRKGRVCQYWIDHPNCTAEEAAEAVGATDNINSVSGWLSMFWKGWGYPVQGGDAKLLANGLTDVQREAISHSCTVSGVKVKPPVVVSVVDGRIKLTPNPACIAPKT